MDLLVLVLDLNPAEWGKRGSFPPTSHAKPEPSSPSSTTTTSSSSSSPLPPLPAPGSFTSVLSQLLVFLSAFLLLSQHNQLAVIAAHPDTARYIYPPHRDKSSAHSSGDERKDDSAMALDGEEKEPRAAPPLSSASLTTSLPQTVQALLAAHPSPSSSSPPLLAGALSLALCHINRLKRAYPKLRARVLCCGVSADSSASYIAMMNAIFSAHKLATPIDSLVLHPTHSLFLQQAASLTSGLYLHLPTSVSLLQHLLVTFLPDVQSRAHLLLSHPTAVDYRATCFCHRRVVEQAMVCPVCLAIYCKATPTCQMCKSAFMAQHVRGTLPGSGAAAGAVQRRPAVGAVKKEEPKKTVEDKEEKR